MRTKHMAYDQARNCSRYALALGLCLTTLANCGSAGDILLDASAEPPYAAQAGLSKTPEPVQSRPALPASVLQSAQFDVSGVELAKIALSLGQHYSARQYAFGQSTAHHQLLTELAAIAQQSHQELLYEMEPLGAQQAMQLQHQSTSHFDRDYLLQQIQLQNAAIAALSVAARESLDAQARNWVDKALGIWRRDQIWVRQVHEAVLIGY